MAFLALAAAQQADATCSGSIPASAQLDPAAREAINALKPMYEQVGRDTGLAWSALAAVDYRESGNDPDRSALSGEPIGAANPDNPGVTTTTKADSLRLAADHLKAMASSVYGIALTAASPGQDLQLGFLAYNRGSIYRDAGVGPERSPYVMNQSPGYADMAWPEIPGEPLAGRTEYGRLGAWTVFLRLGGPGGSCAGLSNVDVVRVAQQELAAGIAEDNPGSDCDCGAPMKYQGSTGPEDWCADFVSWVFLTAGHPFDGGVDGVPTIGRGWRLPGVAQLRAWMIGHGTYEERAGYGLADAAPGDVVIFGGGTGSHTGIVERVSGLETPDPADDFLHTIEGNSGDRVSRRDYSAADSYVSGWGAGPGAAAAVAV